jgi:MFS transporter, CP family, cyanate transporter
VSRRHGALLAALFLAAIALRPQLVGVGPLLPTIQRDLDVPHSVAGLLATIVLASMGIFALPSFALGRRLGQRRAIALSLALIAVFGIGRTLVPGAALILLLTLPVGIGTAVAGSLMPSVVKEAFPDQPSFSTGSYTTGIQAGAAVASAVAVPLAQAWWGWRSPLFVFSVATGLILAGWLWLTRHDPPHERPSGTLSFAPSRAGFKLALVFGIISIQYYGVAAWLPAAYIEKGWSHGSAAQLLTVINLVAVPSTIAVAWAADRWGSPQLYLALFGAVGAGALLGVVLLSGAGWLWATLLGAAIGALFTSVMTLPVQAAASPEEVPALAGTMLGIGYCLSATAPFTLGAVRDATGSFSTALWLIVGDAALVVVLATGLLGIACDAARGDSARRPGWFLTRAHRRQERATDTSCPG